MVLQDRKSVRLKMKTGRAVTRALIASQEHALTANALQRTGTMVWVARTPPSVVLEGAVFRQVVNLSVPSKKILGTGVMRTLIASQDGAMVLQPHERVRVKRTTMKTATRTLNASQGGAMVLQDRKSVRLKMKTGRAVTRALIASQEHALTANALQRTRTTAWVAWNPTSVVLEGAVFRQVVNSSVPFKKILEAGVNKTSNANLEGVMALQPHERVRLKRTTIKAVTRTLTVCQDGVMVLQDRKGVRLRGASTRSATRTPTVCQDRAMVIQDLKCVRLKRATGITATRTRIARLGFAIWKFAEAPNL
jgi:hypothetical protein